MRNSLLICTIFFSLTLQAQTKPASGEKRRKPKTVQLNFEDELVTGSTEKPDVSSLDVKTDFNYKKLIRVRENFVNEMENGIDDFKGN